MTRPLTCQDRLPKEGDWLLYGHDATKNTRRFFRFGTFAPFGGGYQLTAVEWSEEREEWETMYVTLECDLTIGFYRYGYRADGGRCDWPFDCGAYTG